MIGSCPQLAGLDEHQQSPEHGCRLGQVIGFWSGSVSPGTSEVNALSIIRPPCMPRPQRDPTECHRTHVRSLREHYRRAHRQQALGDLRRCREHRERVCKATTIYP
jgi:hypothetical protein